MNDLFTGITHADCGAETCQVFNSDCTSTYSGTHISPTSVQTAPAYNADQNVQAGWTETLCVKCSNPAGDYVQKSPWVVT